MQLLSTSQLQTLTSTSSSKIFLIFCSPDPSPSSLLIPNSFFLDTNLVEHAPDWNLPTSSAIIDLFSSNGISSDSSIVLYSNHDLMPACRVLVALLGAGFSCLSLLNGGLNQWIQLGFPVSSDFKRFVTPKYTSFHEESLLDYVVNFHDVCNSLMRFDTVIVDVRSQSEHNGQCSGYQYIEDKGKIPFSVWGKAGSSAHRIESLVTFEGVLVDLKELEESWKRMGITREKHVVFYCGTGWRASVAFVCALLMGFQKIYLYDGGWLDWSGRFRLL
ncbi:hypothetical protein RCL1_000406 [Eukaryota sp. TZLM3-RCL]